MGALVLSVSDGYTTHSCHKRAWRHDGLNEPSGNSKEAFRLSTGEKTGPHKIAEAWPGPSHGACAGRRARPLGRGHGCRQAPPSGYRNGTARTHVPWGPRSGSCDSGWTATLTTGTLTMVAPPTLTWGSGVAGTVQTLYDTQATEQALDAIDLRGLASGDTGSGWNITATATAFTVGSGGAHPTATIPRIPAAARCSPSAAASTQQTPGMRRPRSASPAGNCVPALTTVTGFPLFIETNGTTPSDDLQRDGGHRHRHVQIGASAAVSAADTQRAGR